MEAEPWEALDLDDSDLPSLLRPCKRHQSQLSNPNPPSQRRSPSPPPPADNPNPRRLIAGPAGAIQAAMHRIGRRNEGSRISTQDYVLRVEEEAAEDFTSDRWVSALDFLGPEGVRRTTCLSDIKKCADAEKIDMVVAMIKGCTPNGLGDVMVVLKDPTDTIQASIHRKVLSEGDYSRQIVVGSVLILQKVSVFSPLDKSFYLNISLSNVVKVIPKDAGREMLSAYTAKGATPECHDNLKIPEPVSLGSGRAAKATTDVELNFNFNGTPSVEKLVGEENSGLGSQFMVDRNSSQYASLQQRFTRDRAGSNTTKKSVDVFCLSQEAVNSGLGSQVMVDRNSSQYASLQQRFMRDRAGSNTMKEPVDLVCLSQEAVADKMASISSCIQPDIDLREDNIVGNLDDERLFATNASQKKTRVEEQSHTGILLEELDGQDFGRENGINSQCLTADRRSGETKGFEEHNSLPPYKASFQEWTDEQLDILDMDV